MNTINERGATQNSTADQGPIGVTWANMLKPMPDLLPDALYPGSKDWLASDYAGRVEWLHRMYEGAKKEIERLSASAVSQTGWVMVPVEPTEKMCAAGFRPSNMSQIFMQCGATCSPPRRHHPRGNR